METDHDAGLCDVDSSEAAQARTATNVARGGGGVFAVPEAPAQRHVLSIRLEHSPPRDPEQPHEKAAREVELNQLGRSVSVACVDRELPREEPLSSHVHRVQEASIALEARTSFSVIQAPSGSPCT